MTSPTHPTPAAPRLVIVNVRPFDSRRGVLGPLSCIVIENDRIVEVSARALQVDDARRIDAGGRVALPGLIDAHVHVTASSHNMLLQAFKAPSLVVAEAAGIMRGMLRRGFTTVRDAAGADFGLREAQANGLFEGPRLFISGFPVSQTGGHADLRPKGSRMREMFCSCAGLGQFGAIADGVDEVRRAVREQVRGGADQIKIMAGGGAASPTDPLEGTQFSMDELRAACEEAQAANLYAAAHALVPRAITRAVQAGVRSIEHGNMLDEASARLMKSEGTFLVPTLSTYAALAEQAPKLGWPPEMLLKIEQVHRSGVDSLRIAVAEGVPIAFGSDLLGHMHDRQSGEFELRMGAMTPVQALQSATIEGARLLRQEGHIGELVAGAWADLLLVDGDPTQELSMLVRPHEGVRLLLQGGREVRNSL